MSDDRKAYLVWPFDWPQIAGITPALNAGKARYYLYRVSDEMGYSYRMPDFRVRRVPALDEWARQYEGECHMSPDHVPGGREAVASLTPAPEIRARLTEETDA